MIGAVHQRHVYVDHGETERPVLEAVEHTFLHSRNIVPRHHAAGDAVLELESGSARQMLDLHDHVAELAMAARLLLVTATDGDVLADRLSIAYGRRPCRDR